ncbi:MAG: hypothetical protein KBT27_16285 [Prevotellaceae bacterium]|nr:hypothetical protein [Candidatus Faecinaster equi]
MPIAKMIKFANKVSGRSSTNVQDVIDEIDADVSELKNTTNHKNGKWLYHTLDTSFTENGKDITLLDDMSKYKNVTFITCGNTKMDRQVVDMPMEVFDDIVTQESGNYLFMPFGYGTSTGWVQIRKVSNTILNVKQANSWYLYGIYCY